jgi:nigerose phosphorylase
MKKNWDFYEPRTEHGSSLSACMYSLLACRTGNPDAAYPFFLTSAKADLKKGGKQWAGNIYIGGTHPASAGGAWMVAVFGFAGLKVKNNGLAVEGSLPENIKGIEFKVIFRNQLYLVRVGHDKSEIKKI